MSFKLQNQWQLIKLLRSVKLTPQKLELGGYEKTVSALFLLLITHFLRFLIVRVRIWKIIVVHSQFRIPYSDSYSLEFGNPFVAAQKRFSELKHRIKETFSGLKHGIKKTFFGYEESFS